jgi:RNA polymerase sigma-70 factor (ECF subfamily)
MEEAFEVYRAYLFAIAYRMLGSAMDAEDMVQETYVRYQATPPDTIRSLKAYLTTILTRLCMDQLQLVRRRRELYVGPWLPEPILTTETAEAADTAATEADPQARVDMQESISLAFLLLLEQLQPFERATFLLREVFGYEFAEIAAMLGKSEAACRRSCSRAKLHLQAHRPRFAASADTHRHLLAGFVRAAQMGDMAMLTDLLAGEVTLWADGGGKARGAAKRPVYGREAVARFILGTRRVWPDDAEVALEEVNGQPAAVIRVGGHAFTILTVEVEDGLIQTIRILANPDKLARV